MTMSTAIALYGGTFDPIHFGHLIAARSVAEQLGVDRTIFIPSAAPPHKDNHAVTPAAHRLEMVRRAVDGEPGFEVSDCEIRRTGPSYTVDTIAHFREELGANAALYWIIGADSLTELVGWYRVGELADACRIVTASRPGCDDQELGVLQRSLTDAQIAAIRDRVLTTPQIDISATDIRQRVREGRSIRYLVPEPAREYIIEQSLYPKKVSG